MNDMLKSIQETKKLFTIEGMQSGQVNIKTSKYLLSLSEDKQIETLSTNLKNLKKDFSEQGNAASANSKYQKDDMETMQLQILIQVIEGMLSQV